MIFHGNYIVLLDGTSTLETDFHSLLVAPDEDLYPFKQLISGPLRSARVASTITETIKKHN